MATYRLSAKLISRSDGRSATGAAAYRSGERIVDERTGEVFDYTRRGDVLDRAILAPANAPAFAHDREALWNAVEAVERRKDAQVAREIQVSLPHELSLDAQRAMLHGWAQEQLVARGMIADVSIHAAHKGGDERNIHAHVLLTTRHATLEGFAGKAREWNDRAVLDELRSSWERHLNRALERAQVREVVNHRSHAARGLDREPEPKQGPVATQMERGGRPSHAGDDRRAAQARNAEREQLRREREDLERREREERKAQEATRREPREREPQPRRDRLAAQSAEPERNEVSSATQQRRDERERILTAAYAQSAATSRLARFWRIERTDRGIELHNAAGRVIDHGERISVERGSDIEARAAIELAADLKGWREVEIRGDDAFRTRATRAALDRGLEVRGHDARAQQILEHVRAERAQTHNRDRDGRDNSERGDR